MLAFSNFEKNKKQRQLTRNFTHDLTLGFCLAFDKFVINCNGN